MKAAVITEYGGLEKVNFAEVDKPPLRAGQGQGRFWFRSSRRR
jgi:hypothetical protein